MTDRSDLPVRSCCVCGYSSDDLSDFGVENDDWYCKDAAACRQRWGTINLRGADD